MSNYLPFILAPDIGDFRCRHHRHLAGAMRYGFLLDVTMRVTRVGGGGGGVENCHNRICHLLMVVAWLRITKQLLHVRRWQLIIGHVRQSGRVPVRYGFGRIPQQIRLELAPEVIVNQPPNAGTVTEDDGNEEKATKR
uniref:Uncharacterized protein n=1 Tax=Anopheles culicifacies TaxID=139723 RepID=A0A182LWX0_9DIPT